MDRNIALQMDRDGKERRMKVITVCEGYQDYRKGKFYIFRTICPRCGVDCTERRCRKCGAKLEYEHDPRIFGERKEE